MELLITAFVLGIIDGVAPGPIFTILVGNLLSGGFRKGMKSFFYASFFDASKAILIVLLFLLASPPKELFYWLGILGGLLLIYFSKDLLCIRKISGQKALFSTKQLAIVHYSNPLGYLAWGLAYMPLMYRAHEDVAYGGLYFIGLLEIGWMIGTFGILMAILYAVHFLKNEKIIHRIFQVLGIMLFFFGGKLIYDSCQLLGLI